MITLAILKDEIVAGQRRAAGRKIRKIVAICMDNYNILLAEGTDPAKLFGKKFVGTFSQLSRVIAEFGLNVEEARHHILDFFARFSGESLDDLSWVEIDKQFEVSKRRPDSSAIFVLYDELRKRGWKEMS